MPGSQRRIDPPVIEQLQKEPFRFGFFQAVRMIERALLHRREQDTQHRLVPGERMVPYRMRFNSSMSLSFPPSEIVSFTVRNAAGEVIDAPDWNLMPSPEHGTGVDRIEMTPAFFGMLGGMGALPIVYTEMFMRREQSFRDTGARAFLDIFTNRATALFYAAWRKYRLPLHYEHEGRRPYLPILLSIAGLEHVAQRRILHTGDGAVFDEAVAGYATAVRHRPVSAVYLQRVLTDYFRCPVRIEQFVGKWYDVPKDQHSKMSEVNTILGHTALSGERVWQRDLRVRLWIGPLRRAGFRAFFPGRAHAKALEKMLGLLAGITCDYEVRLILAREEVQSVVLNEAQGSHLGWDSFITTEPAASDRNDTSYELRPLH